MTIHPKMPTLGEPTFADALVAIASDPELTESQRRYWPTALRQLAIYLGQPLETLPARITAISAKVSKLHPERLGVNAKTFSNHRANAKAALRWFCRIERGTARRAPMADEYRSLLDGVANRHARDVLSPFFRLLSALAVNPDEVDDSHVHAYARQREEGSFKPLRRTQLRQLVRHWNDCQGTVPGWPAQRLTEPAILSQVSVPFEGFPSRLQKDIARRATWLAKPHRTGDGKRRKPCAAGTIALERRLIEAAIRKAAQVGMPLSDFQSLGDVVQPDRAEAILDSYWQKNGKEPSLSTIDLAAKFCTIARYLNLPQSDIERLEEMRRNLEGYRPKGLTRKNRDIIREMLNGDLWPKLVALAETLMVEADAQRKIAPTTSGVQAAIAVAIRILLVAPIRMANIAGIEIGTHLVRPGGPGSVYHLVFESHDVKNHQPLEFSLDTATSEVIERYIQSHRPNLMRGANHNMLFPAKARHSKPPDTFGLQITALIKKRLGIHMTPHQFRHCAAALLLKHHPGNYELTRQVLGHKNMRTTMTFYVGLETIAATRMFSDLVTRLDVTKPDLAPSSGKPRNRSRG